LGVASFVSHPEREILTGKLFNSLFVIGRNGQILGRHRKLNPTPVSEDWASAGEPGRPIPVDGIKLGLLICADAYKPLPALRLRDAARSYSSQPRRGGRANGGRKASGKRGRSTRVCR